jgi:hypothetical protein
MGPRVLASIRRAHRQFAILSARYLIGTQ